MSFKSKKIITELVAGLGMLAGYLIYSLSSSAPGVEDLKGWAILILIALGIGIGVCIVVEIAFHVVVHIRVNIRERGKDKKEIERIVKSEMSEDEMDKSIDNKSNRMGYGITGLGIIVALIVLACGVGPVIALHVILGACFLSAVCQGIFAVVCYEKGVGK
ncbi:MAG: hypothetical protein LBN07_00120 [Christensenellaceae bacterium]|jgi:hypothetical protein|nr:hypothetical protein [Christensenellaceae bacterium]